MQAVAQALKAHVGHIAELSGGALDIARCHVASARRVGLGMKLPVQRCIGNDQRARAPRGPRRDAARDVPAQRVAEEHSRLAHDGIEKGYNIGHEVVKPASAGLMERAAMAAQVQGVDVPGRRERFEKRQRVLPVAAGTVQEHEWWAGWCSLCIIEPRAAAAERPLLNHDAPSYNGINSGVFASLQKSLEAPE